MKLLNTKLIYILLISILFSGCKNNRFKIEQQYYIGNHKTYVWDTDGDGYGDIAASWTIDQDSVTCKKINQNLEKAKDWIKRIENCK